jgi:hypothetical protein
MLALPGLRAFSAERDSSAVSCNARGVFVGDVPLLERSGRNGPWSVRPVVRLNEELTSCYRLPVDVTMKASALALIANALNRGDLPMAAIATVQMQFPAPPLPARGDETVQALERRAADLCRKLDFSQQREAGLKILRECGALK